MTKALEWVFGLSIIFGIWAILLSEHFPYKLNDVQRFHIYLLPVYGVILFGLGCFLLLIYRVFTFNDCPKAAAELRQQIAEAKSDLRKRGFLF